MQKKKKKIFFTCFHVIVAYGVSILAVADNLISNVKYKVEEFTGIEIEKDPGTAGIR